MISKTNGKINLLLVSAFIIYGSAIYFHKKSNKPSIEIKKQDSSINLNEHFIKLISLGNKRMVSDLIWIQTLLESDLEKYSQQDLGNWLYLRFMTISTLDPMFYENYLFGGMYLSIVKDDLLGAANIYEKGLSVFPEDYKLNYNAGFNYYYEMGDYKNGLRLFKKIENHPDANQMVKFLINKLQFETDGDHNIAIAFLEFTLKNSKDKIIQNKIRDDIYALKAERDLKCLSTGKSNCDQYDFEGSRYIYNNGQWKASKIYNSYRIHRLKAQKKSGSN